MSIFTLLVALLTHAILSALAIQIGRGLRQPISQISSISSLQYRHTGYVDQKIRGNAYNILNHESYHLRNVAAVPVTSWNTSLGPSNITSESIAVDESFVLPDSLSSNSSANQSTVSGTARLTDIPELFQSTETLTANSDADAIWNNQTDAACGNALSFLNGIASNLSGLAACYNVHTFDKTSGIFHGDLRLFRIAAPALNWTRLIVSSEALHVSYMRASIASLGTRDKRNTSRSGLGKVRVEDAKDLYLRRHSIDSMERTKRKITMLAPPSLQQEEAKDMYLRRSNGAPPKLIQSFTFTAKIGANFSTLTMNETTVQSLFIPNISFSGTTSDGTTLSTQLSTNDASFVNGLFTEYSRVNMISKVSSKHTKVPLLPGNTFAVFPVGLIITTVWALLLLMTIGYGTLSKIQARDAYRRRVRGRMSGGMGRLYTSSELEALSKNVRAWM